MSGNCLSSVCPQTFWYPKSEPSCMNWLQPLVQWRLLLMITWRLKSEAKCISLRCLLIIPTCLRNSGEAIPSEKQNFNFQNPQLLTGRRHWDCARAQKPPRILLQGATKAIDPQAMIWGALLDYHSDQTEECMGTRPCAEFSGNSHLILHPIF